MYSEIGLDLQAFAKRVYDDILYSLSGYGYTQEEMISVIKQMY